MLCHVLEMYLKIAIHLHVMPCFRDVFENSHTSTCYMPYFKDKFLKIAIHLHVMPCFRDVFENSHTSTCYAMF